MSRRLPIALLAATVGLTAAAPAANAAIYMKYEGISGTVPPRATKSRSRRAPVVTRAPRTSSA